jgi:TorA maturation chaperone TorD
MTELTTFDTRELGDIAQARAAICSFLNIPLITLPDATFVERMRNGDVNSLLEILDQSADADVAMGASLMSAHIDKTRSEDPLLLAETLGVDRTRLYRGVSPSYGPPPPYETVWTRSHQGKGESVLPALVELYIQMDLAPSAQANDRVDYVGVEMDFLCELALREAAAWQSNTPEVAMEMLQNQQAFIGQHLGEWVPFFVKEALQWVQTDFFRGHLLLLRGFVGSEEGNLKLLAKDNQTQAQFN